MQPFQNMKAGRIITFQMMLKDKAGVLSAILSIFANNGANILTINQSIPTGGRAMVTISAETGSGTVFYERLMPDAKTDVLEALLSGDGRAFRLSIGNVNGSRFTIDGGLELLFDVQRRVL